MSKKIIFTKTLPVSDEYFPTPASTLLPEWYKKTKSYVDDKKEPNFVSATTATIKKCLPVFDAITGGYIIPTYTDLWIKKTEGNEIHYLTSNEIDIQFHPTPQAPYHPFMNQHPYPKWINPWSIETPKGYSCLFIPPVHGGNEYFQIAEGIVDTDRYTSPVNFPFVLKDTEFTGLIPAGTPMVQIIPFKRDSWKQELGSEINEKKSTETTRLLSSQFYDRYKKMFWTSKSFK
jgi:hypothetical protein